MANIMTKRGNQDNVITYEHICDTAADMVNIEPQYKTLGSVCIVIKGESGGLEVYIMGSNKEWVPITEIAGGSSSTTAGLDIHICTSEEVNSQTGLPDIDLPDESTIYLVPASETSDNLYEEYIYVNDNWEMFGSGNIGNNLPITYNYQAETVLEFNDITMSEYNNVIIDDITKLREGPATLWIGEEEYPLDFDYYSYDGEDPYYSSNVDDEGGWLEITIPANSGTTNVQCSFYLNMYYGDYESQEDVYIIFPLVSDVIISSKNIYIDNQDYDMKKVATESYVDSNFVTYDSANSTYVKVNDNKAKIGKYYNLDFEPVYFKGVTDFYGRNIWKDGNNIYYYKSAKLDSENSIWRAVDITSPYSQDSSWPSKIWTDGDNIYYSDGTRQYVLNRSQMTWETKQWNGLSSFSASDIWTDGTNIYYSSFQTQRILNKSTSTWETKTWNFSNASVSNLYGRCIWTDGEYIYNTYNRYSYILNENTWSYKSVGNNLTSVYRSDVWTDGNNTYYSSGTYQYILDKSSTDPVWQIKTWDNLTNFSADDIWTDGENIYYSKGLTHYIFNKSNSTWSEKEWAGLSITSMNGEDIWTDGTNIYCSHGSSHVLDKSTLTWSSKTWNIDNCHGQFIWYEGDNIYYSRYSDQYIFNKSTSTWDEKVWNGLNEFNGDDIWTDGENIYYNHYTGESYVLNKETSTWSTKVWNNIGNFPGRSVWTDGTNIYCSSDAGQFKLSNNRNYWMPMYWDTSFNIYGSYIWSDGEDIYLTNGSTNQYKLDPKILRWNQVDYVQLPSNFSAENVWKDGNDVYCTNYGITYKLVKKNKILLGTNGEFYPQDAEKLILPAVTSSDEGKVLTVNSSGEWAAANASGGTGIFMINITYSNYMYYLDKTFGEIKEAVLTNNMICIGVLNEGNSYSYGIMTYFQPNEFDGGKIQFNLEDIGLFVASTDEDYPLFSGD